MSVIATIGTPFVNGYQVFRDADDTPLAGGFLTVYLSGTNTIITTYQDENFNAANTPTITLDSSGGCLLFLDPTNGGNECVSVKILLQDADGVTVSGYPLDGLPIFVPSAGGFLSTARIGYGSVTTLTIQGGLITPVQCYHLVSPQGGSADDLTDIAVSHMPDGSPLIIQNTNASATVTVKSSGNITLENGDCELATTSAAISFVRKGANWVEVSRSTSSGQTQSPVALYTNDTPSATVGATPKDLWTQTIPGGTLANDGESLNLLAYGDGSSTGDMKTLELLVDGVVVNSFSADTVFGDWQLTATIMRFTETTQGIGTTSFGDANYVGGMVDLTADFDLVIRGTGVADGDVTYRMSIVTKNPVGSLT